MATQQEARSDVKVRADDLRPLIADAFRSPDIDELMLKLSLSLSLTTSLNLKLFRSALSYHACVGGHIDGSDQSGHRSTAKHKQHV